MNKCNERHKHNKNIFMNKNSYKKNAVVHENILKLPSKTLRVFDNASVSFADKVKIIVAAREDNAGMRFAQNS